MLESFQNRAEIGRERCFNVHFTAAGRMPETEAGGVQKQALEAKTPQAAVEITVAVLVIPGDGMPDVRGVHARLVHASGQKLDLNQRGDLVFLPWRDPALRLFAGLPDLDLALARAHAIPGQRRGHAPRSAPPRPLNQRVI